MFSLLIIFFLFSTCSYDKDYIVLNHKDYTIKIYNKSLQRPKALDSYVEEYYREIDYNNAIKIIFRNNRKEPYNFVLHDSILYRGTRGFYSSYSGGTSEVKPPYYNRPQHKLIRRDKELMFYMLYTHLVREDYINGLKNMTPDSLHLNVVYKNKMDGEKKYIGITLHFKGFSITKAFL